MLVETAHTYKPSLCAGHCAECFFSQLFMHLFTFGYTQSLLLHGLSLKAGAVLLVVVASLLWSTGSRAPGLQHL